MNQKYERQLKKGVLEILVLDMLSKEEMYGYQMIIELKAISEEMFILKEGTLYPILYRLEDDGLVESYWNSPTGKETSRKYYRITKQGRQNLKELQNLWTTFSKTVTKILGGCLK